MDVVSIGAVDQFTRGGWFGPYWDGGTPPFDQFYEMVVPNERGMSGNGERQAAAWACIVRQLPLAHASVPSHMSYERLGAVSHATRGSPGPFDEGGEPPFDRFV